MFINSPFNLMSTLELVEYFIVLLFPIAVSTSITLTGILFYLGIGIFFILFFNKNKDISNLLLIPNLNYAFLIYTFCFTLSKIVNSGLKDSLNTFTSGLQAYFLFIWIYLFISNNLENEKKIKNILILTSFISIGYGVMQACGLDIFNRQESTYRLFGFHTNPYTYGGQLLVIVFFLFAELFNLRDENIFYKLFILILFLCGEYVILNTGERAVILGFGIGILIYILALLKEGRTFKNTFVIGILLIIPIIITKVFNNKIIKRINSIAHTKKNIKSNPRIKLWKIAIGVWKKNIIFGGGSFPIVINKTGFEVQHLSHAHNVYLQILASNGLIGLLAYLNLIYNFFSILIRNIYTNKYVLSAIVILIAFMIESLFEYCWGDSEVRYFLIFYLAFVIGSIKNSLVR